MNSPIDDIDIDGQYSRNAAVKYAQKWYNKYNQQYYRYYGGDCANFVSQCLHAGGIKMTSGWHSYRTKKSLLQILFSPGSGWDYRQRYKWNVTLSWSKAPNQYNYFKNTSRGYINGSVIKISKKSDITNVAKKKGVQKGDLLYFVKPGKTAPHHAAIIVKVANGKIYYAAHTQSRKCQDLSKSIGKESVLIIRIKS